MAWLDAYIEKCPGFAWEGAPEWNTVVVPLRNKRTRRDSLWSRPRWRFTVPFNNTFPEHYAQIFKMHAVCRGRKHYFRVRNWLRYQADAWEFGTGDGDTTEFQLGEILTVDGVSVLLEVFALSLESDAPEPVVMVDGTPVSAAFNDRTGKVLFAVAPADGAVLTWSGWFDHWVAFMADDFPASIDSKSGGRFLTSFVAELEEVEAPDEDFST